MNGRGWLELEAKPGWAEELSVPEERADLGQERPAGLAERVDLAVGLDEGFAGGIDPAVVLGVGGHLEVGLAGPAGVVPTRFRRLSVREALALLDDVDIDVPRGCLGTPQMAS